MSDRWRVEYSYVLSHDRDMFDQWPLHGKINDTICFQKHKFGEFILKYATGEFIRNLYYKIREYDNSR